MSLDDEASQIRRRMAELRRDMAVGVEDVGRSARQMTDWTFYVRRFPWATAAIAAGIGYMLIPKKKEIIKPDAEMLAEMVKNKQLHVEPVERYREKDGVLKTLLMMGVTWAARAGAAYVSQRLTEAAAQKASEAEERNEEPYHPAPSPLDEPWQH